MKGANIKRFPPGYKGEIDGIPFEVSSGNVFRDLGFPDPEMHLVKSRLTMQINAAIKARGWTQSKAAHALGTSQPTISLLKKGIIRSITYDRLISWLVILKQNVTISVSPASKNASVEVVVIPRRPDFSRTMRVSERSARKYGKPTRKGTSSRIKELTQRGAIIPAKDKNAQIKPIARRPGALKRFLEERD